MSDAVVATAEVVPFDPCTQPSITADQFRTLFPEFTNPAQYPDATIDLWVSLCPIDPCLWGSYYNLGQGYWAAHELKKFGSVPGTGGAGAMDSGPISSKSVGPVSVSFDPNIGTEDGAGSYNYTVYGRQFYHLMKIFGAGPIQVGPVTPSPFGTPWLGPPPYPGWFGG
jgi:hypothetical protein